MSEISQYTGDYRDLSEWVRSFTQAEDLKRRRAQSLQNKESSIHWYMAELEKLQVKQLRRPSAIHQIVEYKRRVRQLELEIALEVF